MSNPRVILTSSRITRIHSTTVVIPTVAAAETNHFLDDHERALLEPEAFRKLLCAIYRVRTSNTSVEELVTITCPAEYYCALPTVSWSIESSLLNDTSLFHHRAEYVYEMYGALQAATKPRNPVLFRELMVWQSRIGMFT